MSLFDSRVSLDALVYFFAMNWNFFRRLHTDAHLFSRDAKYGHLNVVADVQRFTDPSG